MQEARRCRRARTGRRGLNRWMSEDRQGGRPIFRFFRKLTARKPSVVYEDEQIVAVFYPGRSDHLLVTFGDKVTLARGVSFFGDKPLMASDISTLGIMAKKPHWYPQANIRKLLQVTAPLVAQFSERIGYGGSMGGYAVLKYAASFNLSTVISLCPQFSIDNEDLNGLRTVFSGFFDRSHAGMAIEPSDRSGTAFVFFDPSHKEDSVHAALIQGVWPDARQVPVWMVGHGVTAAFAGTRNLADLIEACRRDDLPALQRFAGRNRKAGFQRLNRLGARLLAEKPDLTMKYLIPASFSGNFRKNDEVREMHKRQRTRILELLSRRNVERLQDYDRHVMKAELNRITHRKNQFWSEQKAASHFAAEASCRSRCLHPKRAIRTAGGTVLAFDFFRLRAVHLPVEAVRHASGTVGLIHLDATSDPKGLQVLIDGTLVGLTVLHNGTFVGLSPERQRDASGPFQVEMQPDGTSLLRHSQGCLSAKADGHVRIQSGVPGDAELFHI